MDSFVMVTFGTVLGLGIYILVLYFRWRQQCIKSRVLKSQLVREQLKAIPLERGWNRHVYYYGEAQLAEDAFASILPYLIIAYWDHYVQVVAGQVMVPGRCYHIRVTEDCVWRYDPEIKKS